MSDTLDFSRVGREENDLGLDFSGVGSTGVSTQEIPDWMQGLYSDPDFRVLRDAQSELADRMASGNTQDLFGNSTTIGLSNTVADISAQLAAKYNITQQQVGQALGVYDPDAPERVERTAFGRAIEETASGIGTGARYAGTAVLGGIQIPQQAFFQGLSAQLESAAAGESAWQQIGAALGGLTEVEYRAWVDPRVPVENVLTYGDILQQVGVESKWAVRVGGFAGDVLADPLAAGIWTRGVGMAIRGLGRGVPAISQLGQNVIRAGDAIDLALSPQGVVRGTRAAYKAAGGALLGREAVEALDRRAAGLVSDLFNVRIGRTTLGESFIARGENPFLQGVSAAEGGAGRPAAFTMFQSRAGQTADDVLDFVNERFDQVAQVLGKDRTNNVIGQWFSALRGRANASGRLRGMPRELRDAIEAAAVETADNASPLLNATDDILDSLDDFTIRDAPEGVAATVGEELRRARSVLEETPRSSNIFAMNEDRIREVAERVGYDPEQAVSAFRFVTDRYQEADVLMGFHQSLYAPMKSRFFEEVAVNGLTVQDASNLWDEALRMGQYEDVSDVVSGARALLSEGLEEGEELTLDYLFNASKKGGEVGTAARQVLTDRVIQGISNGEQLGLYDYFNGLWNGHLRRTYALNDDRWRRYQRALERGFVSSNRLIDETLYTEALEGVVPQNVQDLVARYIENISPQNPSERGFLVNANNLGKFLVENGVPRNQATNVLADIVDAANPNTRRELVDRLKLIAAQREGVAEQVTVGPGTGSQFTAARNVIGENGWDEDAMAELGRLLDGQIGLLESGRATAQSYTRNKFLDDVFRWSRNNNVIYKQDDVARPQNFEPMVGQAYGSLNGYWVHPAMKQQVDNVLRNGSINGARGWLYGLNRIRGMVTASWLASPSTTAANVVGGIASAALHGENPIAFARDMLGVIRDVGRYGGIENLPEYAEVADLFRSGVLRSQFSRNLRMSRSLSATGTASLTDLIDNIAESYTTWLEAPLGKGTPGSRLIGLDAFQGSEDIMKLAQYRRVLARTGGDVEAAYRAARNIVFDYDELPTIFQTLRDTGLLLFPGFTVLMTGRVMNAAYKNPYALAAADRIGDAIWNAAIPNDDVKAALYTTLEEYQREGNYIPVRKRPDEDTWSMLPLAQLIPVNPLAGNPLTESVLNLGVYQGLFDMARSIGVQGEATISRQFGQQVFRPSVEGTPQQFFQMAQFLFNSYAPSFIRKSVRLPAGTGEYGGLLPELATALQDAVRPAPDGENGNAWNQLSEALAGKPNRDLFETVLTGVLRSTQPVSLEVLQNRVLRQQTGYDYDYSTIQADLMQELTPLMLDSSIPPSEREERFNEIVTRLTEQGLDRATAAQTVLRGIAALKRLQGTEGEEER